MLLSKLPGNLRDKWARLVMKVTNKKQREATLCEFIDFVSEKTMLMNYPLFSKEAMEQYNEKRSNRQENTKKRITTFVISSKKDDVSGLQKVEMLCIAYGKCHTLDTSKHFMKDIEGENKALG